MANKRRVKMSVSERAKQFHPFAALKGLEEALAAKEKPVIERKELSEYDVSVLNNKEYLLERNTFVAVRYFSNGEYNTIHGQIHFVDRSRHLLVIDDKEIAFADIADISEDKQ